MPAPQPYVTSLLALAESSGTPIPHDEARWLVAHGFAHAIDPGGSEQVARLSITVAGLHWLRTLGVLGPMDVAQAHLALADAARPSRTARD
jgi:hypothetical protein